MRLGINLMAWSGQIDLALLPRIAELGFDGVELPVLRPDAVDAAAVRAALERNGLECTASGALPRGASLLEESERAEGVAWLDRCAAFAGACGAGVLCGPLYAPVGLLPWRPPTEREWDSCVAGLREAGARAAERGVTLALEPLNRFETHFLNTVDDGLRLVAAVGHPAVGLHLDTFHLNVEEKDVAAALGRASGRVAHVHFSENDRGTLGTGHVDWPGVAEALRAIEYEGWVVAETFTGSVPEIAAATAVWRPLVPDPWTYAEQSLRFMSGLLAE
jgi:D-psicose/D-tagatose/L-ribulose 3-epimerase